VIARDRVIARDPTLAREKRAPGAPVIEKAKAFYRGLTRMRADNFETRARPVN
jgi:hypothetical protein